MNDQVREALILAHNALNNCPFEGQEERRRSHEHALEAIRDLIGGLPSETPLEAECRRMRSVVVEISDAFQAGIYCVVCGESLDDGCLPDCVIGKGRALL